MRQNATRTRALRAACLTAVVVSLALGVLGCANDSDLRDRYVAERLA